MQSELELNTLILLDFDMDIYQSVYKNMSAGYSENDSLSKVSQDIVSLKKSCKKC